MAEYHATDRGGNDMREILFRGKRVDNGEWIEGYLLRAKNYLSGTDHYFLFNDAVEFPRGEFCGFEEVDCSTVGQYTELNDKNGVKIFEGDIIRYDNRENVEVIYQPSEFALVFESQKYPQCGLLTKYGIDRLETIGNIHDNPELLKGGEGNGKMDL